MTGRGRAAAELERPVTPMDPTLSTRPVPRKRKFDTTFFGPAADRETWSTFTPIRELKERSASIALSETSRVGLEHEPFMLEGEMYDPMHTNDIVRLLEEVENWEAVSFRSDEAPIERDPTWGFRIFLTSYAAETRGRLNRAMLNLVEATKRYLEYATRPVFAEEAFKRLVFEFIDDKEKLSEASEDRVRAEFRAMVRGLEIADEDLVPPPARNSACLMLDKYIVAILADLDISKSFEDDLKKAKTTTLKVVDVQWKRPQLSNSSYRGRGSIPIHGLARLYLLLTGDGWMEALHLWDGAPDYLSTFQVNHVE